MLTEDFDDKFSCSDTISEPLPTDGEMGRPR